MAQHWVAVFFNHVLLRKSSSRSNVIRTSVKKDVKVKSTCSMTSDLQTVKTVIAVISIVPSLYMSLSSYKILLTAFFPLRDQPRIHHLVPCSNKLRLAQV